MINKVTQKVAVRVVLLTMVVQRAHEKEMEHGASKHTLLLAKPDSHMHVYTIKPHTVKSNPTHGHTIPAQISVHSQCKCTVQALNEVFTVSV